MMTMQKNLIKTIKLTEKKLITQQIQAAQHRKYIASFIENHRWLMIVALFPAFAWGWKKGKQRTGQDMLKKTVEIGIGALMIEMKQIAFYKMLTYLKDIINNRVTSNDPKTTVS